MAIRHIRLRNETVQFGEHAFLTDSRGYLIPAPVREDDPALFDRLVAHPNYLDDADGSVPDGTTLLSLAEDDLRHAQTALTVAESAAEAAQKTARELRAKRDECAAAVADLKAKADAKAARAAQALAEGPAKALVERVAKADAPKAVEAPAAAPEPASEPVAEGAPATEGAHTTESLKALDWPDIRALAKDLKVPTVGRNRDEITASILGLSA